MIRYFFDTEFNSFGGDMLSAGMCGDDGSCLYLIDDRKLLELQQAGKVHEWVEANVVPHLYALPDGVEPTHAPVNEWGALISEFIYRGDAIPQIIADWPSDIADLCNMLITGPGIAVPMGHQTHFTILRHIDVYPTSLENAVQHNALWDAMALKRWLDEAEDRAK